MSIVNARLWRDTTTLIILSDLRFQMIRPWSQDDMHVCIKRPLLNNYLCHKRKPQDGDHNIARTTKKQGQVLQSIM